MPGRQGSRIPELDGMRGIAILMVMLFHFGIPVVPAGPVANVIGFGWAGVDLFFVLSGLLITGILLDSPREGYFSRFYLRRTLRIFPVYYAFLLVLFHFIPRISGDEGWYWVYLANFRNATHQSVYVRHLWSLCIEEQFYLIWPLLLYLIPRQRLKYLCISMALYSPALRFLAGHEGLPAWALYRMTPFRLEGLALGSLLALAASDSRLHLALRRWLPGVSALAVVGITFVVFHWGSYFQSPGMERYGYSCIAIIASFLVLHAGHLSRLLGNTQLRAFGRYSYGLYVWHLPVAEQLRLRFQMHKGWLTLISVWALGIGITLILAWISWLLVEQPCARLKEKLAPSRLKGSTLPPSTPEPAGLLPN